MSRTAALWIGVAVVAVAAAAGWFVIRPDSSLSSPLRVSVELPGDVSLNAIGRGSSVAVSPDGQHVVFVATVNGETRLFDRSLTSGVNAPIAGTEGGTNPFFSPDGRWIGFWTEGQIRKVPATGGIVTTVVNQASFLGAAWAADDTIVFASDPSDGLWRVSADGGRPTRVTSRASGELNHSWPEILPNGDLLFTTWNNTGFDGGRIAVQGPGDNAPTVLVERASYGRVASVDGRSYLVFARPEGLLAAPLDLREKRLAAPPVPVLDGVLCNLSGGANFSLSAAGVLAYVPGGLDEASKTLLWVDQTGSAAELPTISGIGFQYSLSPDGGRIARPNANGPDRDLWVDDLSGRRASVRLTYDEIVNVPVWTRDGQRVIYGKGVPATNLFWRAADGSGDEERLTSSPNLQIAGSVSADGTLLYIERHQQRGFDIYALPLVGPRTPRLFIGTVSYEGSPVFSPDGHWVAYQSDLSGRAEIYVASFPDASVRIRVSVGGGHAPAWSADGRHLYFRTDQPQRGGGDMTIVAVDTTGPEPLIGMPRVLFSEPYQGGTQVGPDGRFLLLKQTTRESSSRAIQLVLNWFDDVRKVLPR